LDETILALAGMGASLKNVVGSTVKRPVFFNPLSEGLMSETIQ
jgi:phosphoribosylcarboxyaminoimidazole (NCAIR) mutase|tara:strand:- start:379 stop:507 length:129 start_codon:yes stop_codon:yes gene_type:complete